MKHSKIKCYFSFFLSFLAIFMVGAYADSSLKFQTPVELHRWLITIFFGIFFFINGLNEYKNYENSKRTRI
jgi:hypothetical protein